MSPEALGFQHRYHPPSREGGPVLLLLHGTGGSEHDLVPLGQRLLPGAGILSPLGKISENGMPRFFRRLAEGVFDEEDLLFRTDELVAFLEAAARHYSFDRANLIAVGYSNGANIAASMLLRHPGALRGAILLRAMLPFQPTEGSVVLGRVPVLLASGRYDSMIAPAQVEHLAALLSAAGADVTHLWSGSGHQLLEEELATATRWAAKHFT